MTKVVLSVVEAIEPPWTELPPVRLGSGAVCEHLLVEEAGMPAYRLELCREGYETWHRTEAIWWDHCIVVGFAERVYFVRPGEMRGLCLPLPDYFGSLHPNEDWLLIASATAILRVDRHGSVLWRSEGLGVDGVVIREIANGVVLGDGEWDPPDGWIPFAISLSDGSRVR